MSESVLREAERIVGARNQDYGDPADDLGRQARMWSAILGVEITPQQVALCMVCVKMSRAVKSPGLRDHYVDMAGYTKIASEL